jgi:endonuclease/exonuclease/phosphatase family metal-dependent hydrolase
MAYNIKHGRGNDGRVDLARTAAVIRRLNPDVVALQEVDDGVDRSGRIDEPEELARRTGLQHHAFGKFFDYQGGEYGIAILSRYPLSDVTNLRLPDGAERCNSMIATVGAPTPFRLASVHFYRTEEERLSQASALLEFLAEEDDLPCIVAGDFNSQPDSPVLELFSDWAIPDKGDDRLTFSSDRPRSEIDFIVFRPQNVFEVRKIDVVDEPIASDHRPVTMDLASDQAHNP